MLPLTAFGPRDVLGADLQPPAPTGKPSHYPQTPEKWADVASESPTPLADVYQMLCEADVSLFDQIRRFRGPWLVSRGDDSDHRIITASVAFLSATGHRGTDIFNLNCKKLQGNECNKGVNKRANAKLNAAFKADDDVHVLLRNFRADGSVFGNSLTVLSLRGKDGKALYRLGVVKVLYPPEDDD
ncbi:hypothetical protein M885DRAFT_564830 [Pelagophyceae sp. CCMP2097]|nr:hypothetical protein M885DRAFT_564830 [Pelagophyceae sp. CCMP2097]